MIIAAKILNKFIRPISEFNQRCEPKLVAFFFRQKKQTLLNSGKQNSNYQTGRHQ
jgi:hypothetical protein